MSISLPNSFRRFTLRLNRFWKRTLPQGLFGRSMVILITPLVLTLGIGLFVFFDRHWSTTTLRLSDSLAGEIALVTQSWEREILPSEQTRLVNLARMNLGLDLRFEPGKKLARIRRLDVPGLDVLLERSLAGKLHRAFVTNAYAGSNDWFVVSIPVEGGILDFYVPQKRVFSTTTYVFLLIMLGSGLFLSIIAVIFMRNQIRPIRQLAESAEKFGKGGDIHQFKLAGAREIRQAAQAFLEMRDRIKRQINQRTEMLAGVSHDLRTPLTRLKLELAMLPAGTDRQAMEADINAMEKMVTAYLDFARGETLEAAVHRDIFSILKLAIADARRQGLKVTAELPEEPLSVMIRPDAVKRVFANLLENARLYAGQLWITVNILLRHIEIIFDDDGPGIAPQHREDVFKPFRRLDDSRNQNVEGTGLGLTIARDLVQSHGGTISLDASPQGGLRVRLYLPL